MHKFNLKTSDLLIFSHFLEMESGKFYTFDKKMIRVFLLYKHEKDNYEESNEEKSANIGA